MVYNVLPIMISGLHGTMLMRVTLVDSWGRTGHLHSVQCNLKRFFAARTLFGETKNGSLFFFLLVEIQIHKEKKVGLKLVL